MATDKCIMAFMFLIVCGVVAIIVVKVSYGNHYHSLKFIVLNTSPESDSDLKIQSTEPPMWIK